LRFQVLAEDAVDHPCPNVAHVEEFGDAEDEFLRRHRGMNGAGAVIDVRGDRPSGAQDGDGGLATRRGREMALDHAWCMLRRALDRFNVAHRNADVYPFGSLTVRTSSPLKLVCGMRIPS